VITATRGMAFELAPSGIRVQCDQVLVAGETPCCSRLPGRGTHLSGAPQFLATIATWPLSTPEDMGNAAPSYARTLPAMIKGRGDRKSTAGRLHLVAAVAQIFRASGAVCPAEPWCSRIFGVTPDLDLDASSIQGTE